MTESRIFKLALSHSLFEQVKEIMEIELKEPVSDDVAEEFLKRHPILLGSIIGYDEVDTEDRSMIWELCRSDFAATK